MSDFFDPGVNQPNEENIPSSGLLKRLLSRRHSSGVVLPKIRSRISRITKNSDLIRKNRLVLPGHTRRERYKSFGTRLLQKQTQVVKVGKKPSTNYVSNRWDQLDMSLPNGAANESVRTNVFGLGLSDLSISSGGQVISPFSPPTSNNEPSFIERRQERLKNQESKKSKPTPTRPEKSTRLFSRVEEILPSSREKPVTPSQLVNENSGNQQIRPENKKPSPDQKSAQKQPRSENEIQNRTTQVKKSDVDQHPGFVGNDNVVQRQVEKDLIIPQNPEQNKSIPELLPESNVQKGESSKKIPQTLEDELKTLASKPSIPKSKINGEINLEEKANQKGVGKSSTKSSEHDKARKIEKPELTQSPKKIISNGEEKKELISRFIPVKETKPISEEKEKIEKTPPIINKKDLTSSSPVMIQRETDLVGKPDYPESTPEIHDDKDFHVEQKLELPVVNKKTSKQTEEKNIKGKPIIGKESAKFPELQKKATQRSVQDQPELQARKSAENVVKLSRQKISVFSSKPNVGKTKPKNFVPLIKKFDRESETEKLVISQMRPASITPFNVIQREPEDNSDNLSRGVSTLRTAVTSGETVSSPQPRMISEENISSIKKEPDAYEKDSLTFPTRKPLKRPKEVEKVIISSEKREEPKLKVNQLKIQQTPLSKKITGKFIEKKIAKTSTEDIRTVQKSSFPLIMRSLEKPKQHRGSEHSQVGKNENQIKPDQVRTDIISNSKRSKTTSTKKNPLTAKLLVTQPGRIAIQNSLQKTKIDNFSLRNEPVSEKNSLPSRVQTFDQNSKSAGLVKQKKTSSIKQMPKEEKIMKGLPKSRTVPEKIDATRKIEKNFPRSKEELPVVQMKKITSPEPTIQPEVAVQGPVIQRIIADPTGNEIQPTDYQTDVELDLSKLAREVYPIIKRWIAVEKERTSGRLY